jgi:GDP-D-mannose 3', 5'-epimerase
MVTINQLTELCMKIAGKNLRVRHIDGPQGVRGRRSDNRLIRQMLGWAPSAPLRDGLQLTYRWILERVQQIGSRRGATKI